MTFYEDVSCDLCCQSCTVLDLFLFQRKEKKQFDKESLITYFLCEDCLNCCAGPKKSRQEISEGS